MPVDMPQAQLIFGLQDPGNDIVNSHNVMILIAPQAQLLETAKSVGPEALFKQVVKFGQFDPLWSILGKNKGGLYYCKIEFT